MYDDFCPECGHLLPLAHEECSFCGTSLTSKYFSKNFFERNDDAASLSDFTPDDRNMFNIPIL